MPHKAPIYDYDDGEFTRSDGTLGRPFDVRAWRVPGDLRVAGGHLVWRTLESFRPGAGTIVVGFGSPSDGWNEASHLWEEATVAVTAPTSLTAWRSLLTDFIRLEAGTDDEIRAFAQTWGILGVCEHFRTHCFECQERTVTDIERYVGAEPLEGWRRYAAQARGLLEVAKRLRDQAPVGPNDWRRFRDAWNPNPVEGRMFDESDRGAKARLTSRVRDWLRVGRMDVAFDWNESPSLTLAGQGLYSSLAIQLAAAIASSPGVFFCDACGLPHFRQRAPKRGQGTYCQRPECKAESRYATRRRLDLSKHQTEEGAHR